MKPGEVSIYLFRQVDAGSGVVDGSLWEYRRGYAEDWVYPALDLPAREARRDALLVLAIAGTRRDLPRIERVFNEDGDEENRWLAASVHLRLRNTIP